MNKSAKSGAVPFTAKLLAISLLAGVFVSHSASAQTPPVSVPSAAKDGAQQSGDWLSDPVKRSEAFYDFTMGRLNEIYYLTTNQSEYATAALDFYKKAYALDPDSSVIIEHLAETYYEAHRISDAVQEAVSALKKDPDNLPVRRLLVRIYLRTLGDPGNSSAQMETASRAIEQLEQIRRLDPSDMDSGVWLVRLYRLRGETAKAETALRDMLQRDPNNGAVAEQAAQLLLDQNRAPESVKLLQGVLTQSPSAPLYDLLGDSYTQLRDYSNAEVAYQNSVRLEPDEPSHLRGLAQTLASEEKYEDALAQYQRLSVLQPDDPDNYLRMAEMDRQLHRLDDAEKNIILAKQRAPDNLEVVYSEAMIYEAQGRYEDAIQMISGAVQSLKSPKAAAPSNRRTLAVLYEQLGRLYRESEKYSAAINTFNEMGSLGDEEGRRASVLIVDTYRAEGDVPHALETAQKALTQYPEDRELRITRALLYGENGDADKAVSLLRELTVHSPEDLEIDLDAAQVYLENKRYADAETALAHAAPLAQNNSEREMVWFMLGGVYERQKKYDQAEEQFKRVIAQNPRSAQALNYYGYMLADRGVRLPEATGLVKRALAEDPNNAAYLDSLGWVYYKQDRLGEAEDSLRQAVEHDHNDAMILDHLGDVYFKSGKLSLAEAQWEHSLLRWQRALPTEIEPDRIAALETKIANVKRQLAQQKPTSPNKQPQN
jgi:tetratricopeptide (TPR) repeat protein